nr:hypothetical protein [Tanacetum cinerariifolium]
MYPVGGSFMSQIRRIFLDGYDVLVVRTGFAAALAVLITRASQSRQHGSSEPTFTLTSGMSLGSVWGHFGDVRPERLRPGDIKLLLVAFDSQLKVFYPLKNDNASEKHPQCHVQVKNVISFHIGEFF